MTYQTLKHESISNIPSKIERHIYHERMRNRLTPSAAKWVNCATGGSTPVPVNDPSMPYPKPNISLLSQEKFNYFLTTEKSYPAVLTPPRKGRRESRDGLGDRAREIDAIDAMTEMIVPSFILVDSDQILTRSGTHKVRM